MKKNIVIFIPKLYHGGGAERSSLAMGDVLSKQHTIHFLTQHPGDATSLVGKIDCLNQKESTISKLLDFIPSSYLLKKYCDKHKIDIVIANMPRANTITMVAKYCFGNKTKNILITRNANSGRAIHKLMMRLWHGAEKNVAVAKGSEFALNQQELTNTTTIYNAFNLELIESKIKEQIPEKHQKYFKDGPVFFTVGRLHKQKGQKYMIDAFAEVIKIHPKAKLLIAGGGILEKDLQDQIDTLEVKTNIILLGNTKNIFPYMRESHCFVLSSLWEGLPTVVIEALASNTYVISTDCMSGPREILTNEPYGKKLEYPYYTNSGCLITPPDHSPEKFKQELTEAILKQIIRPTQINIDVSKYSYSSAEESWEELLSSL